MTTETDDLVKRLGEVEHAMVDLGYEARATIERLQQRIAVMEKALREWRELADDLLEDLELHGLHDSPEWNYRRQKAEFKRLDAALSTAEEKQDTPCPECGGSGRDQFGDCLRCDSHGYIEQKI